MISQRSRYLKDQEELARKKIVRSAGVSEVTLASGSSVEVSSGDVALSEYTAVSGALPVMAQDYLDAIAEGDISGHSRFRKMGYSTTIGAGSYDLWEVTTPAAYVFPTAAMQMQIKAGGNTADKGLTIHSGTATGGSATTITDTSASFDGGTPTAAGDYVVIQSDNHVDWGIVTSAAHQTLTCSGGFSRGITPTGYDYSIIDKSYSGATGTQAVILHYLDASWQEKATFIVLNGASAVDTTPTDILMVQAFHSLVVGTGGSAAGTITLVDKATGAITYALITVGNNSSTQAIWTVPAIDYSGNALTAAYIIMWHVACSKATATPPATFRLRATSKEEYYNPGVFYLKDIINLIDDNAEIAYRSPIKIAAKSDIKVSVTGTAASTNCSSRFSGWYE